MRQALIVLTSILIGAVASVSSQKISRDTTITPPAFPCNKYSCPDPPAFVPATVKGFPRGYIVSTETNEAEKFYTDDFIINSVILSMLALVLIELAATIITRLKHRKL